MPVVYICEFFVFFLSCHFYATRKFLSVWCLKFFEEKISLKKITLNRKVTKKKWKQILALFRRNTLKKIKSFLWMLNIVSVCNSTKNKVVKQSIQILTIIKLLFPLLTYVKNILFFSYVAAFFIHSFSAASSGIFLKRSL